MDDGRTEHRYESRSYIDASAPLRGCETFPGILRVSPCPWALVELVRRSTGHLTPDEIKRLPACPVLGANYASFVGCVSCQTATCRPHNEPSRSQPFGHWQASTQKYLRQTRAPEPGRTRRWPRTRRTFSEWCGASKGRRPEPELAWAARSRRTGGTTWMALFPSTGPRSPCVRAVRMKSFIAVAPQKFRVFW